MTTTCRFTDPVLAHFLDGEFSHPSETPPAAELAGHLGDCDACQDALARGRRLDALLASDSRLEADHATVERLISAVEAVTAQPEPVTSSTGKWATRTALVAAGFAAAFLLQLFSGSDRATPDPDSTVAARQPTPEHTTPPRRSPDVASPTLGPKRPWLPRPRSRPAMATTAAAVRQLEHHASAHELARDLAPMTALRAFTLGQSLAGDLESTAQAIADGVRLEAVAALARSRHPHALPALASVLAHEPGNELLGAMVQRARDQAGLDRRVAQALDLRDTNEQLLGLAAMLGSDRLDASLRRVVEGDPAVANRVADAVALVAFRPGRVKLLLTLWSDLQTRGLERSASLVEGPSAAEARARRWFAALPSTATTELVREARRTGNAGQRRRCLLALAARGDAAATDYLLDVAHGPRFEEGLLAAHALGQCPAEEVAGRLRFELRRSRRPELLLAALASSRFPAMGEWLAELDATAEEKRFLLVGRFHFEQFEIAAKLFRNAHLQSAF